MMIKQIAVIGAGCMGAGIAQVCATKNLFVQLIDIHNLALSKARKNIQFSLEKLFSKKHIHTSPIKVLEHIQFTNDITLVKNSDLIIEAVPENTDLKCKVFQQISALVKPDAIIASNTSSISISLLAKQVTLPQRVAGMHFMNPVPLMPLVEMIKTTQTTDSVFQKLLNWVKFLGKTPVISQDQPGFIVNRILMPMINEAIKALQNKVALAEAIDKAMCLGCHHKMGPLALADFIGLDVCLAIMEVLEKDLGNKYQPCSLLKEYVAKGHLGKKTGQGFYTYEKSNKS